MNAATVLSALEAVQDALDHGGFSRVTVLAVELKPPRLDLLIVDRASYEQVRRLLIARRWAVREASTGHILEVSPA